MPLETRVKLTFGFSAIYVFAVFVRDGINRVRPLLTCYRITTFIENICPSVWKDFWATLTLWQDKNFYGFRNATNVRYNCKTSSRNLSPPDRTVSVIISNLVTEDVEQKAMASSPIQPLFWKKYAEDIISVVSTNEVERLVNDQIWTRSGRLSNSRAWQPKMFALSWFKCSYNGPGKSRTSICRKTSHTDKYHFRLSSSFLPWSPAK